MKFYFAVITSLLALSACGRSELPSTKRTCAILTTPALHEGQTVDLRGAVVAERGQPQFVVGCETETGKIVPRSIPLRWRAGVKWHPPTGDAAPVETITGRVSADKSAETAWYLKDTRRKREVIHF